MKMLTLEEYQTEVMKQSSFEKGKSELHFDVTLPSLGKHGYKGTIRCRPLKVGDIKELVTTKIENDLDYIRKVVSVIGRTILDPIDVNELTWNDLLKVIVALRVNSLGNNVEITWTCPNCSSINSVVVDLVELNEVEIDSSYPGDPFYVTDKFGNKYLFKFPRVGMFLNNNKSLKDLVDFDLLEWMYVGEEPVEELPFYVAVQVLEFIKKFDNYGIQTRISASCSSCKNWEGEVEIPFFLFLAGGNVI